MSPPPADPDFLAYAAHRDPEAFQRLVERHLPLIHLVAERTLGNLGHLAPDVAQKVFLRFARKAASLPRGMVLPAWLHRQAVRIALDMLRVETRRKRREKAAQQALEMNQETEDAACPELIAALDRALVRLPERDREILALRYFEGGTIRQVAERVGVTTAAAQKRIERALQKLRGRFSDGPAGAASVSMLMAALSARSDAQDLSVLAKAITSHALASAPVSVPFTNRILHFMSQSKLVLLSALAGCATAAAVSAASAWNRAADPAAHAHGGRRAFTEETAKRGTLFAVPTPASNATEMLEQVRLILSAPDTLFTRNRLAAYLQQFDSGQLQALAAAAHSANEPTLKGRLMFPLFTRWVQVDALAAMAIAETGEWAGPLHTDPLGMDFEFGLGDVFEIWAANDLDAAGKWLASGQDRPELQPWIFEMVEAVGRGLMTEDPQRFLAWLGQLQGDETRSNAVLGAWLQLAEKDPANALTEMLALVEDLPDREAARAATRRLLDLDGSEHEHFDLVEKATRESPFRKEILDCLFERDPLDTLKLLTTGNDSAQAAGEITAEMRQARILDASGSAAVAAWLVGPDREELLMKGARLSFRSPEDAVQWIALVGDPSSRATVLAELIKSAFNESDTMQTRKLDEVIQLSDDAPWPQDVKDALKAARKH